VQRGEGVDLADDVGDGLAVTTLTARAVAAVELARVRHRPDVEVARTEGELLSDRDTLRDDAACIPKHRAAVYRCGHPRIVRAGNADVAQLHLADRSQAAAHPVGGLVRDIAHVACSLVADEKSRHVAVVVEAEVVEVRVYVGEASDLVLHTTVGPPLDAQKIVEAFELVNDVEADVTPRPSRRPKFDLYRLRGRVGGNFRREVDGNLVRILA